MNRSFNEEFCSYLEHLLSDLFKKSDDVAIRSLWCDGISWNPIPENQLNLQNLFITKNIVTKAWMGSDGQDEWEMTIQFGEQSLKRYANNSNLIKSIPDSPNMDWISIDIKQKSIEIKLN